MTDRILYHHRTRGQKVEGVHIRSIAGALRDEGYQVDILSLPGVDPEAPQVARSDSGNSVVAPGRLTRWLSAFAERAPEILFELAEIAYNILVFVRVGGYIRRHSPRWIYERYSLFMFATVIVARRHGIPLVLEISDSAVRPRVRRLLLRGLAARIEKWVFNHCDGLVFVSGAFREQVLQAHGTLSASIVSPNAADAKRFDPSRYSRDEVREHLGLSGKRVCGYLGGFVEWHGIHRFIDQLAPRIKPDGELRLLLVGDGRTRPRVRRTLEDSGVSALAVMPGNLPHDDVPRYLVAMDFSVLPDSNTYGSPVKLFELMAMEVPVVAPDYGPIREVITHGRTGWLFPAGDMHACMEMVLSLDDEAIRQVGKNARAYIVAERQWSTNARQLIELFRRVEQTGEVWE